MSSRRQHLRYMVSIIMSDVLPDYLTQFPTIDSLKPEQIEALELLLAGCNVIAILPTGFGKSLIYRYQAFCLATSRKTSSVNCTRPIQAS